MKLKPGLMAYFVPSLQETDQAYPIAAGDHRGRML